MPLGTAHRGTRTSGFGFLLLYDDRIIFAHFPRVFFHFLFELLEYVRFLRIHHQRLPTFPVYFLHLGIASLGVLDLALLGESENGVIPLVLQHAILGLDRVVTGATRGPIDLAIRAPTH